MYEPTLNEKSNAISTDMQLLKALSVPSSDCKTNVSGVMSELTKLLKLRNCKFNYSKQDIDNVQQWVKRKGINMKNMTQKYQSMHQKTEQELNKKKSESDCEFYIDKLGVLNQREYIEKNFEFGVLSTIQHVMSSQKHRGSLARRILLNKRNNTANASRVHEVSALVAHPRNKRKKDSYVKVTCNTLENLRSLETSEWINGYRAGVKESVSDFWDVLYSQIAPLASDHGAPTNQFVLIAIASLKRLESEFNRALPTNYDSILHYLNNMYLGRMSGEYEREGQYGARWGIAYLLYQAGRTKDFYEYIPDPNLKECFQQADLMIKQYNPQKIYDGEQTNDAFHNQLLFALRGNPKYSSKALCDKNTYDIAWIFLRNVAIFGDEQKFMELRTELFQEYCGPLVKEVQVKNLLYLLGYAQIVEIGPNDLLDKDDFVHFLISIYYIPQLRMLLEHKIETVKRKLTEQLLNYIHQLLLDKDDRYIYYMILIPETSLPNQVSSIIVSELLLERINWKIFRNYLSQQTFQSLVNLSLLKYISSHHEYLKAAKQQCQLLDGSDNETALNFLLQMNVKSMLEIYVSPEDIRSGFVLAKQIMHRDQNLSNEYRNIFQFFQENQKMNDLNTNRNQHKIYEFFKSEADFLLVSEQLSLKIKSALNKLIVHRGFECYVMYVRNALKAYEILFSKTNRHEDLKAMRHMTEMALRSLLQTQPYSAYAEKSSAKQLLETLEAVFYRNQ